MIPEGFGTLVLMIGAPFFILGVLTGIGMAEKFGHLFVGLH